MRAGPAGFVELQPSVQVRTLAVVACSAHLSSALALPPGSETTNISGLMSDLSPFLFREGLVKKRGQRFQKWTPCPFLWHPCILTANLRNQVFYVYDVPSLHHVSGGQSTNLVCQIQCLYSNVTKAMSMM